MTMEIKLGAEVIVIPCSAAKLPHPAPAGELYTGSWHRLARSAADAIAGRSDARVVIMSALHGLLELDELVEPYDVSMASLAARTGPGTRQLAVRVGEQLTKLTPATVTGLLPAAYRDVLAAAVVMSTLNGAPRPVTSWPLRDCPGVGYQRQRLVELRAAATIPLS
jgi:hypothetical protein